MSSASSPVSIIAGTACARIFSLLLRLKSSGAQGDWIALSLGDPMEVYAVCDSVEDKFAGSFTNPKLAGIVLKIFEMAVDEQSEIRTVEADEFGEQLLAGLKPFKIEVIVDILAGKVTNKEIKLCWPPACEEGIIEEREGYVEYFFWAKTSNMAIQKLSTVHRPANGRHVKVEEAYI